MPRKPNNPVPAIVEMGKHEMMVSLLARNPGMTDKKAAKLAGFQKGYKPDAIKKTNRFKNAVKTIEQQREELQEKHSLTKLVDRLNDFASNSGYKALMKKADRLIKAGKEEEAKEAIKHADWSFVPIGEQRRATMDMIRVLGLEAPQKIDVTTRGLIMEFNDLSAKDLQELRSAVA